MMKAFSTIIRLVLHLNTSTHVEHYASKIIFTCVAQKFYPGLMLMQGWVIIRDTAPLIEAARSVVTQLRWDARILDLDIASDEKLLVCQKPFLRK